MLDPRAYARGYILPPSSMASRLIHPARQLGYLSIQGRQNRRVCGHRRLTSVMLKEVSGLMIGVCNRPLSPTIIFMISPE
jgi:hypothetical protein